MTIAIRGSQNYYSASCFAHRCLEIWFSTDTPLQHSNRNSILQGVYIFLPESASAESFKERAVIKFAILMWLSSFFVCTQSIMTYLYLLFTSLYCHNAPFVYGKAESPWDTLKYSPDTHPLSPITQSNLGIKARAVLVIRRNDQLGLTNLRALLGISGNCYASLDCQAVDTNLRLRCPEGWEALTFVCEWS